MAAITTIEHGPLEPGSVARALRGWERLARRGHVYRPASNPCGEPECCGPGTRAILADAIRCLPARAKPALRHVVNAADQVYLSNTLPDPLADAQAAWWERRRPIGWP
jgi:hypothetical protein